MRKLIAAVVIFSLAWGAYWFVGATAMERTLTGWIDQQQARGAELSVSSVATRGFPNRFDTTIGDVHLADPSGSVVWDAPFVQILSLSYKPNHVILALPHEQSVTTPLGRFDIGSARMRGSVIVDLGPTLPLDRSNFVAEGLTVTGPGRWSTTLREGRIATRRNADPFEGGEVQARHDLGIEFLGLVPDEALRRAVDPQGILPDMLERARLDATLAFDRPLDRHALEGEAPRVTRIDLSEASARWGALALRVEGSLDVDDTGELAGRLDVTATNWREMLRLAVAMGAVPEGLSQTVERGLELAAGLSGDAGTVSLPLEMRGGRMSLGPLPLGRAPRLGGY